MGRKSNPPVKSGKCGFGHHMLENSEGIRYCPTCAAGNVSTNISSNTFPQDQLEPLANMNPLALQKLDEYNGTDVPTLLTFLGTYSSATTWKTMHGRAT